jgi:hypothetical protein
MLRSLGRSRVPRDAALERSKLAADDRREGEASRLARVASAERCVWMVDEAVI